MATAMNMSVPTDIQSYIDTNYNTGAETDFPSITTIISESYSESFQNYPAVAIIWRQSSLPVATTGTTSKDDVINGFDIVIAAENSSTLSADKIARLILTELRRVLNNKSVTTGHWHIDSFTPVKYGYDLTILIAHMTETVFTE